MPFRRHIALAMLQWGLFEAHEVVETISVFTKFTSYVKINVQYLCEFEIERLKQSCFQWKIVVLRYTSRTFFYFRKTETD